MNLLGHDIDTISTGTLTDASKEDGLGINVEKFKYSHMLLPRH
jgi:hypothetical protein